MAKFCDICGKGPRFGHNVSHAHNITHRRFEPNIHKMKAVVKGDVKKIRVCTRCLRSGKVQKPSLAARA